MTDERRQCHHTRITQDCPYCLKTDERKETVAEIVAHLRSETGDDGLSRADVLYLANAIEAAHAREIAEKDAVIEALREDLDRSGQCEYCGPIGESHRASAMDREGPKP